MGRASTYLIAVAPEIRDQLLGLGIGDENRFRVIPVGFDLEQFAAPAEVGTATRNRIREALGIPPDVLVVLIVARLVPIKRIDRFLRVVAQLQSTHDVRALIVGSGELQQQLEQQAKDLGIHNRTVWAGFRTDIAQLCWASDLAMLTSDAEGTPVSLIEAHAAGLPVVATRAGGSASVVRDGISGYLAELDAESDLADLARRLLDDHALARAFGAAGRVHVTERYSLQQLIRSTSELYDEALAETAERARRD
jgi:glycosyltransferase involved in cell wall biosynthesis